MSEDLFRIPVGCVECDRSHGVVSRPGVNAAIAAWLDVIDDLVRQGWSYNDFTDHLLCPQCTNTIKNPRKDTRP